MNPPQQQLQCEREAEEERGGRAQAREAEQECPHVVIDLSAPDAAARTGASLRAKGDSPLCLMVRALLPPNAVCRCLAHLRDGSHRALALPPPQTPGGTCVMNSRKLTDSGPLLMYLFHEVEPWLQDNPDVLSFYRSNYTLRACLRSMFRLHNETQNIWSHILGALLFVMLLATRPALDAMQTTQLAGYAAMFGLSAAAHCLAALPSEGMVEALFVADRVAIGVGLFMSTFAAGHYHFACLPDVQRAFCGASVAVLLLTAAYAARVRLADAGRTQLLFALQLLLALVPILREAAEPAPTPRMAELQAGVLSAAAAVFVCCVASAFFYALRIPERFAPGKFDLVCGSHFLMHCTSLASALACFWGVTEWQRLAVLRGCMLPAT